MAVTLALNCMLPMWLRLLVSVAALLAGGVTLRSAVLLRGRRALRAVAWPGEDGEFDLRLGPELRRVAAIADGCQRYGSHLWVLRFRTAEGQVLAVVDAGRQEPRDLRRLSRRLFGLSRGSAGPVPAAGRRQADTIPAKV